MKYKEAIRDATALILRSKPGAFVFGIGVTYKGGVFGTTVGLEAEFGSQRVFDVPACENTLVGLAIGASMHGMHPILVNQRMDFVLYSADQLINHAAKWKFMFNGRQRTPIVVRNIVGRGWGQGPQHSQSFHALWAHIPGLRVLAPSTPYDAKGMLIAATEQDDPVMIIEHRRLYDLEQDVPEGAYRVCLDKAAVVRSGTDVTFVATSQMVLEASRAADILLGAGISVEVIDLRALRPLDRETVLASVEKTGRLVAIDGDWGPVGVASEVLAIVAETCPERLKAPARRLTWPDMPCPTSVALEDAFYPKVDDIVDLVSRDLGVLRSVMASAGVEAPFMGPF